MKKLNIGHIKMFILVLVLTRTYGSNPNRSMCFNQTDKLLARWLFTYESEHLKFVPISRLSLLLSLLS